MSTITFSKACKCNATATRGRITMKSERTAQQTIKITATFNPGPVCNKCDTPWTKTSNAT